MNYQFQEFKGRNVRLEKRITITKSSSIGFPQKFYQDNEIKNYKFIVFYWDKINQAIGIRFTNNKEEQNRFSIIHSKIGYGGSVAARSFLKTYNIDPQKYHGRYEWKKEDIEGIGEMYIIDLKKEMG